MKKSNFNIKTIMSVVCACLVLQAGVSYGVIKYHYHDKNTQIFEGKNISKQVEEFIRGMRIRNDIRNENGYFTIGSGGNKVSITLYELRRVIDPRILISEPERLAKELVNADRNPKAFYKKFDEFKIKNPLPEYDIDTLSYLAAKITMTHGYEAADEFRRYYKETLNKWSETDDGCPFCAFDKFMHSPILRVLPNTPMQLHEVPELPAAELDSLLFGLHHFEIDGLRNTLMGVLRAYVLHKYQKSLKKPLLEEKAQKKVKDGLVDFVHSYDYRYIIESSIEYQLSMYRLHNAWEKFIREPANPVSMDTLVDLERLLPKQTDDLTIHGGFRAVDFPTILNRYAPHDLLSLWDIFTHRHGIPAEFNFNNIGTEGLRLTTVPIAGTQQMESVLVGKIYAPNNLYLLQPWLWHQMEFMDGTLLDDPALPRDVKLYVDLVMPNGTIREITGFPSVRRVGLYPEFSPYYCHSVVIPTGLPGSISVGNVIKHFPEPKETQPKRTGLKMLSRLFVRNKKESRPPFPTAKPGDGERVVSASAKGDTGSPISYNRTRTRPADLPITVEGHPDTLEGHPDTFSDSLDLIL